MMKLTEEKYIRIHLIPRWKFNRYRRTWGNEYWIHNSNDIYKYRDIYEENKEFIIEGRENIIKALKLHKQSKG